LVAKTWPWQNRLGDDEEVVAPRFTIFLQKGEGTGPGPPALTRGKLMGGAAAVPFCLVPDW
jgi:hypothetical protein